MRNFCCDEETCSATDVRDVCYNRKHVNGSQGGNGMGQILLVLGHSIPVLCRHHLYGNADRDVLLLTLGSWRVFPSCTQ